MKSNKHFALIIIICILIFNNDAQANDCSAEDRTCLLNALKSEAALIKEQTWKDQVHRELAKTLAFDGKFTEAISIIDDISRADTKAMAIRGIGMAAADINLNEEEYKNLFNSLLEKASSIEHPPSYAIALTYIAMSQAFAGDNEGAWQTAKKMENDALRNKAYGETAEIQAEAGDAKSAMKSIAFINSASFRNKAYATTSKILADRNLLENSLQAALKIENPYKKAQAIQHILDIQKPREVKKDKYKN